MQLHQIRPQQKMKKSRRIGRGGKRGHYSGRGLKGQKSRAGAKIRPAIRDLMMKLPKRRGANFKSLSLRPQILNLSQIEAHFEEGEVINSRSLLSKNLVSRRQVKLPIKILSEGNLKKKLVFEKVLLSKQAREKIERAGGIVRI